MVKTLKDQNAPKKPLSGYFMWLGSGVRDKLRGERKTKRAADILKMCGRLWNEMPDSEKKTWQDKSKEEVEVWKKAMLEYEKTDSFKDFQKQKEGKSLKKPKDENKPKKPLTGYFRYLEEYRKTHNVPYSKVMKEAGSKWKGLDDAVKKKYVDEAAVALKKYEKDVEKYKKSAEYTMYQEKLEAFKVNTKNRVRKRSTRAKQKSG